MIFFALVFFGIHGIFLFYSYYARKFELSKLEWSNIREPHHNYWSHGDHVAKTQNHHIDHSNTMKRCPSNTSLKNLERRGSHWHGDDDVKTPPTASESPRFVMND